MAGVKRKADNDKFYAVRAGKKPGVYSTWIECKRQIDGFRGASYKSFHERQDAQAFVDGQNPVVAASDGTRPPDKFYAVAVGNAPGIYTDWETTSLAIKNCKGPRQKKFASRAEAVEYIRDNGNAAALAAIADELADDADDDDEEDDEDGEGDDDDDEGPPPAKKSRTRSLTAAQGDSETFHDENLVVVHTDGSSLANGRAGAVAGVGVFFGLNDPRNVSERLQGPRQTNQRAELTAILRALQRVRPDQHVRIVTDSQYSISSVTDWYKKWQKNQWQTKSGDVQNKDLVVAIRASIDQRAAAGTKTEFKWVKGHEANQGNIAADALAVSGAKRAA